MASLILLNASLLSFVHLKFASFLIISWSGLIISAKLEVNLVTKFILPKKDCICLLLCGSAMIFMASILPGSIVIPFGEIKNLNNVPSSMENILFFGFNDILYR